MNQTFETPNPNYQVAVRESFDKQGMLRYLGAQLKGIQPGQVVVTLPFSKNLTQQHNYIHAGAVTTIVDVACGYAALSLLPAHRDVLTVEFKTNFLSPAQGERLVAIGKVIRPGRTLTVCQGEVFGVIGDRQKLVAAMQATIISRPVAADGQGAE